MFPKLFQVALRIVWSSPGPSRKDIKVEIAALVCIGLE
jgi:hypothetical protein